MSARIRLAALTTLFILMKRVIQDLSSLSEFKGREDWIGEFVGNQSSIIGALEMDVESAKHKIKKAPARAKIKGFEHE